MGLFPARRIHASARITADTADAYTADADTLTLRGHF